ncbi:hypothetical protein Ciccas_014448, partial [Cichlidogyrus casuarinus]
MNKNVQLPKFEISSSIDLVETLRKMGVKEAFVAQAADFSRLQANSAEGPYVSNIVHKAYLKIDEQGAEAAAAT